MVYDDVVGTPVPPSYGFWANMEDYGHKFRLAKAFVGSGRGLIGSSLSIDVSLFGLGGLPPQMSLKGMRSKAALTPPFTDVRFAYALAAMETSAFTKVPDVLPADSQAIARKLLGALPEDGFAAFSPDGRRIAFISWRGSAVDVYTARADGTELKGLGGTSAIEKLPPIAYAHSVFGRPIWSPDGSAAAYIADGHVVVGRSGSPPVILEGPSNAVTSLAWSPDGNTIAAVLSGQEDNMRAAQDIALLDPSGKRETIFLGARLDLLQRMDVPVSVTWSPDSKTLAIAINLTEPLTARSAEEEPGIIRSVVWLLDNGWKRGRAVELDEWVSDFIWNSEGDGLLIATNTPEGQKSLIHVNPADLSTRRVFQSSQPIALLGGAEGRVSFLAGTTPLVADVRKGESRSAERVRVETTELAAGRYGGYVGVEADILTTDETGTRVILLQHAAGELPGVQEGVLRKDGLIVIVASDGTFPPGWLAEFLAAEGAVDLDWSPRSGLLAVTSGRHGILRLLVVRPGREPTNLSSIMSGRGTTHTARAVSGSEKGGSSNQAGESHPQPKELRRGIVYYAAGGLVVLLALVAFVVFRRRVR
jgi:WD40 repeat protein